MGLPHAQTALKRQLIVEEPEDARGRQTIPSRAGRGPCRHECASTKSRLDGLHVSTRTVVVDECHDETLAAEPTSAA
jgi:hypothetical protein